VADRFQELLLLVPGLRELHLRMTTFEHMLEDGAADVVKLLRRRGVLLDLWTLDAETPNWRERLQRGLDAGADIITSNTPRELAAAAAAK
jgi:hypothetical protein